ncbi:sensor histidine kinase [Methylibium sp.]|uniref:sensor histidine kinase n=1 Tax=Methylibium sp. TaxID=2067992 RepID=UPI00286D30AD|nr:sensor histidine kinase [Methylibium sp.]
MWSANSLRAALIGRLVPALAVIGIAGAAAAYALGERYANLAYDRSLSDDVVTLAGQLALREGKVRVDLPSQARKWLLANEGERVLYRVIDLRDGTVLDSIGNLGAWARDAEPGGAVQFRDVTVEGVSVRVGSLVTDVPQTEVPVLIEVGETLGRRQRVTRQVLLGSLLLFTLMIGAAVAVIWRGTQVALDPLKRLAEQAAKRSGANLQPLELALAPVEVRALIEAINLMMARLSRAMQSQSHFIANSAHQLRTPLAGLRLQAQLALDEAQTLPLRARLLEIEGSARRAAHLVEQLLTLAKAESGSLGMRQQPVDLIELVRQVIQRLLPAATLKDIDLGYEGQATTAMVLGSEVLLGEMLSNLVDNAIRHASNASVVTISVAATPEGFTLKVADDGDGLPPSVMENPFARFNSIDTVAGGAGLGLAIVKEIAEQHLAVVSNQSAPHRGTEIAVSFRAALQGSSSWP